jgi:hypothetical protein
VICVNAFTNLLPFGDGGSYDPPIKDLSTEGMQQWSEKSL